MNKPDFTPRSQNRSVPKSRTGRSYSGSLSTSSQSCHGILEILPKGFGFVRQPDKNLSQHDGDVYVPLSLIDSYRLRQGSEIHGHSRTMRRSGSPKLTSIEMVNGFAPNQIPQMSRFEDLTPTNPTRSLYFENTSGPTSMRVLDLLCPFGMGQRALIASPPRAGKTTLLKQMGCSISDNHPDVHLAALLIDERPEEVTDMRSEMQGEIFASSLDEDVYHHARLSRLVLNRCQRLAESGRDVVLLVDSLTRLSRACNKLPQAGVIGAGGLNIRALDMPKQLFSSARAFKEGGSLTIIATVLIETENRMDEIIFNEFKGTGNLDIVLCQRLAERRIWPALDIGKSATRRVELLQDSATLSATSALRASLLNLPAMEGMKELVSRLAAFSSNANLVTMINESLSTK